MKNILSKNYRIYNWNDFVYHRRKRQQSGMLDKFSEKKCDNFLKRES